MRILHIASVKNTTLGGVSVAVPQHIISQQNFHDVALLNLTCDYIGGIGNLFLFKSPNWIDNLNDEFKRPDLVVFHEVYYFPFVKISRDLRRRKIPYIIIPHGCLVKAALRHKFIKKMLANLLFFNKFINNASVIQCLSDSELKNTNFRPRKIIGTNGIRMPIKYKENFTLDGIRMIYIGRIDIKIKGLDLLIDAISLVASELRMNNVTIDIYGPATHDQHCTLEKMISDNSVTDIVSIRNPVVANDKLACLLNSDVFIQTSRHEGMPMGILEALSCGLPCLVTTGTSLGGFISEYNAGWVADTSVASIRDSLLRMIDEKDYLLYKSNNAKKIIEDNFMWDKINNKLFGEYQTIIDVPKL